jgi:hypothetical protein
VVRSTRRLPLAIFVRSADSVQFLSRLPGARTIGILVGAARLSIGAVFLAAPVASVRLLGLDSATAARVTWLARMTAARDGVVGAGTVASSVRRSGAVGWLLAGAVSDAADAAVLVSALRQGKLGGWRAQAISAGAIGAALVAAAAAADIHRHD